MQLRSAQVGHVVVVPGGGGATLEAREAQFKVGLGPGGQRSSSWIFAEASAESIELLAFRVGRAG